jgi:hypothetical protein
MALSLQYVSGVSDLFRSYCDEPDTTFLTAANVAQYLELGYNEFREFVSSVVPNTYAVEVTLTPTGTSYDLATGTVKLLGATPTTARMVSLLSVKTRGSNDDPNATIWSGVPSKRALQTATRGYYLEGTTLYFSAQPTGTLALYYIPESTVNWANVAGNEWIDDLVQFHDLIALIAYKQYAIRDGAVNQALTQQMQQRMTALVTHISRRNFEGPQYISRTRFTYEGP